MRRVALGGAACAASALLAYAVRGRSSTLFAPSVYRGSRDRRAIALTLDDGLREAQRRLHLLGVMWTVLGLDWKLRADAIARRVMSRTGNGAILCLHDGRGVSLNPDIGQTLEAVRRLVPALQSRGFRFETVT